MFNLPNNNNNNNNQFNNQPKIKYTWNNINMDKNAFCGETPKMLILKVSANDAFNYIYIPKTHVKNSTFLNSLSVGIANERDYRVYFGLGKDAQYTTIKGNQLYDALTYKK